MPTASPSFLRRSRPGDLDLRRMGTSSLVLGFDPGLHRTGYGAISIGSGRPQVHEAGVLSTRADADLGQRLCQLYRDVEALVKELRPDLVVLEDLFAHHQFPRTAIVLGHVRGIICLAAAEARIAVVALAPAAVKRAIAGSGRASKPQVQAAVRTLLGIRRVADPHAADALALAYAGGARLRSVRR